MINTRNQQVLFYLNHRKEFKDLIKKFISISFLDEEKIITIFDYKNFLEKNKNKIINYDKKIEKINNNINQINEILNNNFFEQLENIVITNNILKIIPLKDYLMLLTFIEFKGFNKNVFFIDYKTKQIKKNMFNEFKEKNKNIFKGIYNKDNQNIFSIFINKLFSYIYFTNVLTEKKEINFRANVKLKNLEILFYLKNIPYGYLINNNKIKFLDIGFQTNINLIYKVKNMLSSRIEQQPFLIEHFVEFKNLINRIEVKNLKNISPYFELYLDENNPDLVEYIKNYLDNINKITYNNCNI